MNKKKMKDRLSLCSNNQQDESVWSSQFLLGPLKQLRERPRARFSKVPKLFGHISGRIILFVCSKRRRLEARNFAVILIYIPFTTYEKKQLYRISGSQFYEWLFGPEMFSGLSRNRPLNGDSNTDLCDAGAIGSLSLCATITSPQMMDMGAGMAQWWEHSPPTNVAQVRFPDSTQYVGWVWRWFTSLLREVFLRVLRFSPLLKNQHLQIAIRSRFQLTNSHSVEVPLQIPILFYIDLHIWCHFNLQF